MAESSGAARVHVGFAGEDEMRRFVVLAALALVVLNATDLVLTRQLLSLGGSEANPLLASVIAGPWGIVIKLGVPALLAARYITAPVRRRTTIGLGAVVVLYFGVVLWNLHLLLYAYG